VPLGSSKASTFPNTWNGIAAHLARHPVRHHLSRHVGKVCDGRDLERQPLQFLLTALLAPMDRSTVMLAKKVLPVYRFDADDQISS
jgi:hypothetical protein